jgi:hypothetical protein
MEEHSGKPRLMAGNPTRAQSRLPHVEIHAKEGTKVVAELLLGEIGAPPNYCTIDNINNSRAFDHMACHGTGHRLLCVLGRRGPQGIRRVAFPGCCQRWLYFSDATVALER